MYGGGGGVAGWTRVIGVGNEVGFGLCLLRGGNLNNRLFERTLTVVFSAKTWKPV